MLEKGKPVEKLGPRLRLNTYVLSYAWPGEAKRASI